jgi:UDP-N-acetylmuramoyl-tripeptide--D-alanyl-D-alanine ligase
MAAWWRIKTGCRVIAVTGSCGKTSTKEMISTVLSKKYKTGKTTGNFNNHIGLPLAILGLKEHVEVMVLEMGMNHLNEIDYLCSIAKPDAGVITSIAPVHTCNFDSIEGIIKAKSEMLAHLKPNSPLFWNMDDPGASKIGYTAVSEYGLSGIMISSGQNIRKKYELFGLQVDDIDIFGPEHLTNRVEKINFKHDGSVSYNMYNNRDNLRLEVKLSSFGSGNVSNSCLALAVASYFDIPQFKCIDDLENYSSPGSRLRRIIHESGALIIDDSYNSNPFSMVMACDDLSNLPISGKKYVIMGDMLELGDKSVFYHEKVIKNALDKDIEKIFLIGPDSRKAFEGLKNKYPKRCEYFENASEAGQNMNSILKSKDALLIKGSRGIKLEKSLETMKFESPLLPEEK